MDMDSQVGFTPRRITRRKMVIFINEKNIFYLSLSQVYGVLRRVIRSVWTRLQKGFTIYWAKYCCGNISLQYH